MPQDTDLRHEYEPAPSVTEIFPLNNMGVTTGDDKRFVAFSASDYSEDCSDSSKVIDFSYRPFDTRQLYYAPDLLARARLDFMRHMSVQDNIALITIRRPRNDRFANFFVSNGIADKCFISSLDNCHVFPLYALADLASSHPAGENVPNIDAAFLGRLAAGVGIRQLRNNGLPEGISPTDILNYAYAVFHSITYRTRYAEFLKVDFPRLPIPGSLNLFRDLASLGGDLVKLHLMKSPTIGNFITTYHGPSNPEVGRVGWSDSTVWLDAEKTSARDNHRATKHGSIAVKGVPEEVWDFHIGGYQVCHKWLKDRKNRTLSKVDLYHYQKIVVALNETIRIMDEIDEVIDQHGGWPDAFVKQSSGTESSSIEQDLDLQKAAEDPGEYSES